MKHNLRKRLVGSTVLAMSLLFTAVDLSAQVNDRVLVIVNDDVITQSEFDFSIAKVRSDAANAGQALPEDVNKQLLDSMINDRLQLQEAERRSIEVGEDEIDDAIARFAEQQGLTVVQLEQSIGNSGQAIELFRKSVKESLTISLLTEFYANNRVFVPEYEIEGAMTQNKLGEAAIEYQVAHLFIKDAENNLEKAQSVRDEIVNGLDFSAAVARYSEGAGASSGGLIGWRTADSLPELFVEPIKSADVGGISDVLVSENGLHILKLVERKGERIEILQSKVRHILIEAEGDIAMKQAAKRLTEVKERILAGEDFAELARIYSDDSVSAAEGGSLDWVSPGQMVKPFEDTFKLLEMEEVSEPVETQFGMHIIQVMDRRQENVTEIVMRNRVRGVLRRQRANREFSQWVRQLKEQAYIDYVSEPTS